MKPRQKYLALRGLGSVLALATSVAVSAAYAASDTALAVITHYHIPSGRLADALDLFSEQSDVQIVYDASVPQDRPVREVVGPMQADQALARILAGSGLAWSLINGRTIAIRAVEPEPITPATSATSTAAPTEHPADESDARMLPDGTFVLGEIRVVVDDPMRVLPNEISDSTFGFSKSLLETPRSVSFISKETIDHFGLSAVEDLVRVVPGTYTPTRFGIQGGIDIRGVPADTFFRGMKRLNLQGHAPTVLESMDSIEVVRGPPSPIYGMGKIGGYTNMVPRSGRARDGSYLDHPQVQVSALRGSYDRSEMSVDLQGPAQLGDSPGGYHLFGMMLDTQTYARGVPIQAQLAQAAISLDHFVGGFRLETGVSAQAARSAGALIGRMTQDLVDTGRYIRGVPLVNLDLDDNGSISYREMHTASPARGTLSVYNQPLVQRWDWPKDAQGNYLRLDQLPKVRGIPESFYNYLMQHPEADPTGLLRAQGVGGPRPGANGSGYVPAGYALDPRTVGYDTLDLRRFSAFERELQAELVTVYVDLIDDSNPDLTLKNQLFFDGMDQYKISEQPFGTEQKPRIWEDKFTITRRLQSLPSWLAVNSLASVNLRHTRSPTAQCFGDFSTHRTDAMADTWVDNRAGMTPNTTFANCLVDSGYESGFPYTDHGKTENTEFGVGLLYDVNFSTGTNLLFGGRFDLSRATNIEYAGTVNFNTGTSAAPGQVITQNSRLERWDHGVSWTFSVSQPLLKNVRAYMTLAQESLTLDNNANRLTPQILQAGHIGQSRLRELGLKASLFDERLFFTTALYEQYRINVTNPDDPTLIAEASSTRTEGWESEIKWVPVRGFFTSFYSLLQKTTYNPNRGGSLLIDARTLGFMDVVDPATGDVIYPAEAFLFGGRAFILLPPGMEDYARKQSNPSFQLGMTLNAQHHSGLGFTFSSNYFSSVPAGRLQLIELPAVTVLNAGIFYEHSDYLLRLDAFNFSNERYFRARSGDTLADLPISAMPGRRWQLAVSKRFK